jgi:hypothetical protein
MLTIFATCKPFKGHFGTIQRNAIISWTKLVPKPEIILFGNDEGTAGICQELNLKHIPDIACNEYGAPLLDQMFQIAQKSASNNLLCYINADIIVLSDFMEAVKIVKKKFAKFLMVGRIWRCNIENVWDFSKQDWEISLRNYVLKNGAQAPPPGNSDFYLFNRDLWNSLLPLAIGRGGWDSWLIYKARKLNACVIDASEFLMAVHQNHDRATYKYSLKIFREEHNKNYEIIGKRLCFSFSLMDATHLLTPDGLKKPLGIRYLIQTIDNLPILHPYFALLLFIPRSLISLVRAVKEIKRRALIPVHRLKMLVLSKLSKNGVIGIVGLKTNSSSHKVDGVSLAQSFLGWGYPVVVYEPDKSTVKEASKILNGPIEFSSSLEKCICETDVIILLANSDEFKDILLNKQMFMQKTLIDCCSGLKSINGKKNLYSVVLWK